MAGGNGLGLTLYQAVLMSAVMAALVVMLVTRAIERFGGLVGGVLGTVPSTIVVASIGFWNQLDRDDFLIAMHSAPVSMLAALFNLYLWRVLPARLRTDRPLGINLALCVLVSVLVWGAMAVAIYLFLRYGVDSSVMKARASGLAAVALSIIAGLGACIHRVEAPKGLRHVSWPVLLSRGIAAGSVIALAVYLSSLSALIGSIVSTFPVIFMTSMVALWLSQGAAVPVGATGPMMLGATSVQVCRFCLLLLPGTLIIRPSRWHCLGTILLSTSLPRSPTALLLPFRFSLFFAR